MAETYLFKEAKALVDTRRAQLNHIEYNHIEYKATSVAALSEARCQLAFAEGRMLGIIKAEKATRALYGVATDHLAKLELIMRDVPLRRVSELAAKFRHDLGKVLDK
jgi:hypothetical protein